MPTVPRRVDPFRILQQGIGSEFVPSFAVRAPSGPNSILESPELGRVLLEKALESPVDPLSPKALLSRHFHAESGQERPSLTSGPPPTVRDRAKDTVTDLLGGNRDFANRLVTGAEFAVPPIGAAFGAYDFGRSVASGNFLDVGIGILGVGPGKPFARRGVQFVKSGGPRRIFGQESRFEDLVRTATVADKKSGKSELKTKIRVERPERGSNEHITSIANIGFTVDGLTKIPSVKTSPGKARQVAHTVNNIVADFIAEEIVKRRPFVIRFRADTPDHEKFYKRIQPELEEVYGIRMKTPEAEGHFRKYQEFRMEFPADYELPAPPIPK